MIKTLMIFLIILFSMLGFKPESLIGKNIAELDKFKLIDIKDIDISQKRFVLKKSKIQFFHKNLNQIIITCAADNEIITSVSSNFNGSLTNELFQQIVSEYGNPDMMAKKGVVIFSENSILENGAEIKEEKGELIPCELNEKPIIINWYQPKFEIRLTVNYQRNTTLLIIKEPNKSQQLRF